ncbi:S8 family serine peptidase [Campylobacter sp. MOP51]|uniref:S8 family serine peptidase n=1 Tax=Campylobacter canis TaxID=3378588 RepID=UPI003C64E5D3
MKFNKCINFIKSSDYKFFIILAISSIMLTACGGGGGGGGSSGPSTPSYNAGNNQANQIPPMAIIVPPVMNNPVPQIDEKDRIVGLSKGEEKIDRQVPLDQKRDENKITDIAIVDTFFYKNNKFKQDSGDWRIHIQGQNDMLPKDKTEHGTMVASIIADHNKNARIFAYKGGFRRGGVIIASGSDQFDDAYKKGARIFNNSYGSDPMPNSGAIAPFDNIARYAQNDSIFVWAAGNESKNNASPQALYPSLNQNAKNGWIAVMAVANENDSALAWYSNKIGDKGKTWGITAKGNWDIEYEPGKTKRETGTSFATPRVTAAVANVWEKFPWMNNHLVTMTILSSANKPGTQEQTEAPDPAFGWGILNEQRALKGPGRLDSLLLTDKDEHGPLQKLFTVNFDHRDYMDKSKLTWSNNIAGDAGIHKKGTGTLYLTGENTYKSITWIEQGTISISNLMSNSEITIEKEGTLLAKSENNNKVKIGNGKNNTNYTYTITNNGGSLNVYGVGLKIDGDYISKDNGRMAIDIDRSNLEITGSMDMGNSSYVLADVEDVRLVPKSETQTKKIITASEIKNYSGDYKISENVSKYINLSNFYMDKTKQNIYVEYNRNSTEYVLKSIRHANVSSLNTARNLDAVLDDVAEKNEQSEISNAAIKIVNAKAHLLPQMIDSLSGEIHSSSQNILIKQNSIFNRTLSNRIASLMHSDKSGFWIDGIYADSKIHKEGYADSKAKIKGSAMGLDTKPTDEITLGVALVKGESKANFDEPFGNINIKNNGVSIYGSYDFTNFYTLSKFGINASKNEVQRTVIDSSSSTSYKSRIYNLYTELGTIMKFENLLLNPFAAFQYSRISRGKFEENVPFGIVSNKTSYKTNSFTAGLRTDINLSKFGINSGIAYTYTPSPENFAFDAKFKGSDKNIKIKGISEPKNSTHLSLGLNYKISDKFIIDSRYILSMQDSRKNSSAFSIGCVYRFN